MYVCWMLILMSEGCPMDVCWMSIVMFAGDG